MDDIKADIAELKQLEKQASRKKVKDLITIQTRKWESELEQIKQTTTAPSGDACKPKPIPQESEQVYNVPITTYGMDQSAKFYKLYIDSNMAEVHKLPADRVVSEFTSSSLLLRVLGLNSRNYELSVAALCEDIVPDASSVRVKDNKLVVMLKKAEEGKTWPALSAKGCKSSSSASVPMVDKAKDPNESMMEMMKQMYEDGDDDMKRTIAKAWTESRDKNPGAGMPDL